MFVVFSVLRIFTVAVEAIFTLRFVLVILSLLLLIRGDGGGVLVIIVPWVRLLLSVNRILPVAAATVGTGRTESLRVLTKDFSVFFVGLPVILLLLESSSAHIVHQSFTNAGYQPWSSVSVEILGLVWRVLGQLNLRLISPHQPTWGTIWASSSLERLRMGLKGQGGLNLRQIHPHHLYFSQQSMMS